GSIDVYRKETQDLLFLVDEAQPAILSQKFRNLPDSKIVNQGVEFSLGYDLVQTEDFNWSANFNIAYNDNMVESLSGQYDFANVNGPGLSGAFAMRLQEGHSLFSYYLLEFDGYDGAGQPIISEEKSFVGKSALPNLTGGLSTNLSYKRFTMSAYFNGQFGHYIYNNTANAFFTAGAFNTTRNVLPETLTSGEALGASAAASTRFLEKGDFVRLQNLSLAYDMPLSGEGVFKSMVFSVTGQNLWLSTDYSGLDPEVSSATGGNLPSIGMDYGAYPNPTTITFGINAKF
ncbi:TonB-dependent receptor, partial [Flavobacteriaceae bacterium]|nr:TonB-dependent receptor [Flavobacteriaceae bacterium]